MQILLLLLLQSSCISFLAIINLMRSVFSALDSSRTTISARRQYITFIWWVCVFCMWVCGFCMPHEIHASCALQCSSRVQTRPRFFFWSRGIHPRRYHATSVQRLHTVLCYSVRVCAVIIYIKRADCLLSSSLRRRRRRRRNCDHGHVAYTRFHHLFAAVALTPLGLDYILKIPPVHRKLQ